jgi:NAD(P)-dependent dehydrogenase (short-subunit alcohol dehydrogenase family)
MLSESFDLNSKTAIVTGSGRGLGRAMARALAWAGAAVMVADIVPSDRNETVKMIESEGGHALDMNCDVSNSLSVKAMVDQTLAAFGSIDILVNNAGLAWRKPLLEETEENWNRMLGVNLTGLFNCCRAVGPRMVAQGHGKIINIASTSGVEGEIGYTAYTTTKAGVILFTKTLALEWARHNINVNAIGPGWFHTPLTDPLTKDPIRFEEIMRGIPQGRLAKPEEIGPLVVFLASRASDFMTGSVTFIDGGQLAGIWP